MEKLFNKHTTEHGQMD